MASQETPFRMGLVWGASELQAAIETQIMRQPPCKRASARLFPCFRGPSHGSEARKGYEAAQYTANALSKPVWNPFPVYSKTTSPLGTLQPIFLAMRPQYCRPSTAR